MNNKLNKAAAAAAATAANKMTEFMGFEME